MNGRAPLVIEGEYRDITDITAASGEPAPAAKSKKCAPLCLACGVMATDADKAADKCLVGIVGIILLIVLLATLGAPS